MTASPAAKMFRASSVLFIWIFCLQRLAIAIGAFPLSPEPTENWLNHGRDLYNTRYANLEHQISPETASKLHLKWKFFAGKDITATPAIFEGILYFPSWNGKLYAVDASDGSLVWEQSLQNLTGLNASSAVANVNATVSRATPTIAGDLLLVGIYGPAVLVALKLSNGELVWQTQLDSHPLGVVTMSGTYYKGAFYVGVSSLEEGVSIQQCCIFRGSFLKADVQTGKILWKTYMIPDNHGRRGEYAGASVWGSSPPIDSARNSVYIGTGNLYSAPLRIQQCQAAQNNLTAPTSPDPCIEPDNHSNSILALDLNSGEIKWYRQLGGYDVWFLACNNLSTAGCPVGPSADADFSEAPMMLCIFVNGTYKDIVVASQKSGFVWALDRDNGNLIWGTEAGPGGAGGGAYWGSATDNMVVYTNIANSASKNFTLKPSAQNTTSGGWVAMKAQNGEILWSTADPANSTASGPVTLANGVLFAGSTFKTGPFYAIDGKTGSILWSYETGATIFGGASVSEGCVFVGSGYKSGIGFFFPNYTAGTSLFAFCIY